MATDFTQDTVLHFLQCSGGSVKNADLLLHFRNFVRDHPDRERNRELFKKFVNCVATVQQIDGVSHVVLRRKFRGHVPGGGEGGPAGKRSQPSAERATPSPASRADKPRQKTAASPPGGAAPAPALPAAGIILNNNNNNNDVETNFNLKHKQQQVIPSPEAPVRPAATQVLVQVPERLQVKTPSLSPGPPVQDQLAKVEPFRRGLSPPPGVTPVVGAGRHPRDTGQQVPAPEAVRVRQASPQPGRGLHQEPPHPSDSVQVPPRRMRHRPSYKSAVSYDDGGEEEEEEEVPLRPSSAGGSWPVKTPFQDMQKDISASSPCIMDTPEPPTVSSPSSSERSIPQIHIQNVTGDRIFPAESGAGPRGQWTGPRMDPGFQYSPQSTRRSLPLKAETYSASPAQAENVPPHRDRHGEPAGVQLEPRLGLDQDHRVQVSSSHSSILSPPSGSRSPRGSEWTSSLGDLQARSGETRVGWTDQGESELAMRMKSTPPCHHSTDHLHYSQESPGHVFPWHRSTGDLYDSSEDSASSPQPQLRPAAVRRLNSQLRSRMCRSLGADLDQLLQEEEKAGGGNEVARLNRLHMISSSLSLPYNLSSSSLSSCSTPSRSQSCADLVEGVEEAERKGGRRSLPTSGGHQEGHSRQSQVPLESREHAWLVKGATAAWPDIYSLFREDSSLLNRRDFISGFTVLHWIAKHGDHRVLNTLWYGVEKAGLTFDIDARSSCGQTPLHIAAIHGHKNIMRLLVGKFSADVRLRDTAGKKPWQYLSRGTSPDIFQLLGAPPQAVLRGEGGAGRAGHNWRPDHRSSRRRRHHFSSSGERPLTAKVKRSSSLAAFLKHKSLQRFHGHQSDSSI